MVTHRNASLLADIVLQLFGGTNEMGDLEAKPDEGSNSIVFIGSQGAIKSAKALLNRIDAPSKIEATKLLAPKDPRYTVSYELKNVDPKTALGVIKMSLGTIDGEGETQTAVYENQIILNGKRSVHDLVAKILKQLDKAKLPTFFFLEHRKAEDALQFLKAFYKGRDNQPEQLGTDAAMNSIFAVGSDSTIDEITELIDLIDRPAKKEIELPDAKDEQSREQYLMRKMMESLTGKKSSEDK